VAEWRERVRIIVYLEREPPPTEVEALLERVRAFPDVAGVRFVGKAEAMASLRRVLGKEAAVADQLPANPLPASLEVTPVAGAATPEGTRALASRLAALPEADEVEGGVEWVERLSNWQRLLASIGLGIGAVLALAAILTVTTSTTLVLHLRRRETEIMRLVGAPESAVRLPLLIQGTIQGLLGACLALALLVLGHRIAAPRLEPLFALTLGLPRLDFLTPISVGLLLLTGAGLGGVGGWLARGREAI
jgi:cell division transport system permease protein